MSVARRLAASLAIALIPAVIFIASDTVVSWGAGRVDAFPSVAAYRLVLDTAVLARYAGLLVAGVLAWGPLRGREAQRWLLAVAVLSGPVAYAITEFVRVQAFFPVGEAAYYMVNPLFVGGVGSQAAAAAVGEAAWRLSGRWRGVDRGPVVTWRIATAALAGWGILFVTLVWGGGVHWFYVYQQGYTLLFHWR